MPSRSRERWGELGALAGPSGVHPEGNGDEENMGRIYLVETGKAPEGACVDTHRRVQGTLEVTSSLLSILLFFLKIHSGEDADT